MYLQRIRMTIYLLLKTKHNLPCSHETGPHFGHNVDHRSIAHRIEKLQICIFRIQVWKYIIQVVAVCTTCETIQTTPRNYFNLVNRINKLGAFIYRNERECLVEKCYWMFPSRRKRKNIRQISFYPAVSVGSHNSTTLRVHLQTTRTHKIRSWIARYKLNKLNTELIVKSYVIFYTIN